MDTDDNLFLDSLDAIVLDALRRIGADPKARYAVFRNLLAAVQVAVGLHTPVSKRPP